MERKLHRSQTDRLLAGVCGGLSEYLGIDSNLIRLFFILAGLATGIGFAVYLIMWVIVPYEGAVGSADAAQTGAQEIALRAQTVGEEMRDIAGRPNQKLGIWVGGALLAWGLVALMRSLHIPWLAWLRTDLLWPVLLIVSGAALIWRHDRAV